MKISDEIKRLRKKKGLGIKSLAEELDVNYTYLSKIENDKSIPSEAMIKRIAKYFHVSEDELLLMAEKIPEDIKNILKNNPKDAIEYLRRTFGSER